MTLRNPWPARAGDAFPAASPPGALNVGPQTPGTARVSAATWTARWHRACSTPPTMRLGLLFALLALPALAGPVDDARAEDVAAHQKVEALLADQARLRSSLNEVSAKVAQEKAAERARVVPSSQLQADLRQAQALSDSLDPLAKQLDAAQAEAKAKDAALVNALDAELARTEQAWSATKDPAQRAALVQQVRALDAERERLLPRLPEQRAVVVKVEGDDPADLLAQADALRDSEDKIRRQLAELDRRLAEAKQTRELDRRMNELGADEAMFDEQGQLRSARGGRHHERVESGTARPGHRSADARRHRDPRERSPSARR